MDKSNKIYRGVRNLLYKATIYVDTTELSPVPSLGIKNYAPEFEWGYLGSGPSQTSLGILYDITNDKELALKYHTDFKYEYIAQFDQDGFVLLESQVMSWLQDQQKLRGDL